MVEQIRDVLNNETSVWDAEVIDFTMAHNNQTIFQAPMAWLDENPENFWADRCTAEGDKFGARLQLIFIIDMIHIIRYITLYIRKMSCK